MMYCRNQNCPSFDEIRCDFSRLVGMRGHCGDYKEGFVLGREISGPRETLTGNPIVRLVPDGHLVKDARFGATGQQD